MAEERKERTELANDRTMLASERTLAAWWRTTLAALAAAVALAKLLDEVRPLLGVRVAATMLVALALLVLFIGARRYTATARRIESVCVDRVPRAELWIGTTILFLLAVGTCFVIWVPGAVEGERDAVRAGAERPFAGGRAEPAAATKKSLS